MSRQRDQIAKWEEERVYGKAHVLLVTTKTVEVTEAYILLCSGCGARSPIKGNKQITRYQKDGWYCAKCKPRNNPKPLCKCGHRKTDHNPKSCKRCTVYDKKSGRTRIAWSSIFKDFDSKNPELRAMAHRRLDPHYSDYKPCQCKGYEPNV